MKAKVTEELINIFKLIFLPNNESHIEYTMTKIAFDCINTILIAMKKNDHSFTNKNPAKLTFDEKSIFDFIELLTSTFKNNVLLIETIMNTFLNFEVDDLHQEAYVRRSLVLIYNLILKARITDGEALAKIIPSLEAKISELVNLRYNGEIAIAMSPNFSEKSPSKQVSI
jgi:hypothetical protein